MSKCLVIADIHIRNYMTYNPEPGYRLKTQPLMLADRILELANMHNSNVLFILGDLIDNAVTVPDVSHVLDEFFRKLSGLNIYFILGQHDLDTKDFSVDYTNKSIVTLIASYHPNVTYGNGKTININGKSIYLSDYSDVINYPKSYVDVWLSHVTIGLDNVDTKNFGIGIFGDIHDTLTIGKCWTVGTPYQHQPSGLKDGCIGLLDLSGDKASFSRVPSDTEERKFLRFNPMIKKISEDEEENYQFNKLVGKDIQDQIKEAVIKTGLAEIHSMIDTANVPSAIDFNFKLKELKLENYNSFDSFSLNFDNLKKVICIEGLNGSGKSTITNSIYNVLTGDTSDLRDRIKADRESCKIELTLFYNGSLYTVSREAFRDAPTKLKIVIDGEPLTSNNKRGLEEQLKECFPFLPYLSLFMTNAGSNFFAPENREELLKICFNLHIYEYFYEEAVKLELDKKVEVKQYLIDYEVEERSYLKIKEEHDQLKLTLEKMTNIKSVEEVVFYRDTLKSLYEEGIELKSQFENKNKYLLEIQNQFSETELFDKNKLLSLKEELLSKINSFETEKKSLNKQLEIYTGIVQTLSLIDNEMGVLNKEIDSIVITEEEKTEDEILIELEEINKKNIEFGNGQKELLNHKSDLVVETRNISNDIQMLNKQLKNKTCPTCGRDLAINEADINLRLEKLEKENSEIKAKIVEIDNQLLIENPYMNKKEECDKRLSIIKGNKELKNKIIDYKNRIEELSAKKIVEQKKLPENVNDWIAETSKKVQQNNPFQEQLIKAETDIKKATDMEKIKIKIEETKREVEVLNNSLQVARKKMAEFQNSLGQSTYSAAVSFVDQLLEEALKKQTIEKTLRNAELLKKESYEKLKTLTDKKKSAEKLLSDINAYKLMFDSDNLSSLSYKVLENAIKYLNNDTFKISSNYEQKNGKKKFKITCSLFNGIYYIPYERNGLSGGQRCMVDIHVASKLTSLLGNIGLITFDEGFSALDKKNYDVAIELIDGLAAGNIIVSTHSPFFNNYGSTIALTLDTVSKSTNYKVI